MVEGIFNSPRALTGVEQFRRTFVGVSGASIDLARSKEGVLVVEDWGDSMIARAC